MSRRNTVFHRVWDCPKLSENWKTVVEAVLVVGVKVAHRAELCVLGILYIQTILLLAQNR